MSRASRKIPTIAGSWSHRPTTAKCVGESSPFTQFETTVIEAWLGLATVTEPDFETALKGLGVSEAPSSYNLNKADVAIAQLVLHSVRRRLPNSGVRQKMDDRATGRSLANPLESGLSLLPWHMLTVGWTCNGSSHSIAEAYYLAWLPYYDRYVVTASRDTSECWGYYDAALGDFSRSVDPMRNLQCIISDWWTFQAYRYRRARWRYVFRSGLVSSETAHGWAEGVWDTVLGKP